MNRSRGDSSDVLEMAEEIEGTPMGAVVILEGNGLAGGLAGMVAVILSGSDSK